MNALLLAMLLASGAQAQEPPATPEVPAPEGDGGAADAFARMDSNRDGQLSLEEFEAGIARPFGSQKEGVVYQKLPARFRMLDADGDSFLDAKEYDALAPRWQGHGDAPPPLAQADRNHDGRIDFREFALIHAPSDADAQEPPGAANAASAATP